MEKLNEVPIVEKEIKNIFFVKTLLMIIIVLYHSLLFWSGNWFTICEPGEVCKGINIFTNWLNTFHVYGFIFVSGYLFYYLKYYKEKYNAFVPFLKNKICRLLIPFIVFLIFYVFPIGYFFYKYSFNNILHKFILLESPAQLWFLLTLFLIFIMFYPLSNFFKDRTIYGLILVIFLFLISIVASHFLPNVFQIWTTLKCFGIFYLGFKCCGGWNVYVNKVHTLIWIIIDIMLFVLYLFVENNDGLIFSIINAGALYMLNIIGAIMIWKTLQFIATIIKTDDNKFILFLSKRSMCVYLFHQQIIYFIIWLLNDYINSYVLMILNFIIALFISLCISSLLLLSKYSRFLIGEK